MATVYCVIAGCGGGDADDQAPGAPALDARPSQIAIVEAVVDDGPGEVVVRRTLAEQTARGGVGLSLERGANFAALPWSLAAPDRADVQSFGNHPGTTYYVGAEAPGATAGEIGSSGQFIQIQRYRKVAPDATLDLVVTGATLEILDDNGDIFLSRACPWLATQGRGACLDALSARIALWVQLSRDGELVLEKGGIAEAVGFSGHFESSASTLVETGGPLAGPVWSPNDFDWNRDVHGDGSRRHARLQLRAAKHVPVDLTQIPQGSTFTVVVQMVADAINRRGGESHALAYLRDPRDASGLGDLRSEATGLEMLGSAEIPQRRSVPAQGEPVACTIPTGSDAGRLSFARAEGFVAERLGAQLPVLIERVGGTRGEVSVRVRSMGGSAAVGADYAPVDLHVVFGDGDAVPRSLPIPFVDDGVPEPDKTIELTLSDPGGCAELGATTKMTVTLLDDDRPLEMPALYSVGGTVTGLAGSGLVIGETVTGRRFVAQGNASFRFGDVGGTGAPYDVRVLVQPRNPDQACTVRRGSGTLERADVNDVVVECVTVQQPHGLDPDFGTNGKVAIDGLGAGKAVAVQSSGRIVVLTSAAGGPVLAGFTASGAPDASFGSGGRVPVRFTGGILEEAEHLALQPDDKLVVVGRARNGTRYDMGVARFHADGTSDTGFANQGVALVNPLQRLVGYPNVTVVMGNHRATRALIDAAGRILVAGVVSGTLNGSSFADFAVARLNPDGSPDAGFGESSFVDISGGPDIAHGLGVQSDGKVVLAGMADNSCCVGLARFKVDGRLDTDDPRTTSNYGRDGSGKVLVDPAFAAAGASDMAMLPGDAIAVASVGYRVHPTLGSVTQLRVLRVDAGGRVDRVVETPLGP
jgi:uncharacterized delta-60 repeat protein